MLGQNFTASVYFDLKQRGGAMSRTTTRGVTPSIPVDETWSPPDDAPFILVEGDGDTVEVTHRLVVPVSGHPTLLARQVTTRPMPAEAAYELVAAAAQASGLATVHYRRRSLTSVRMTPERPRL
jgi:hypothetical protein